MRRRILYGIALLAAGIVLVCAKPGQSGPNVTEITSVDEFKTVVAQPGKLLVFDLYADWCQPCRMLSPMLEEVAAENADKASFYKINVDNLRELAGAFQVQGIPYVVFLKDNAIVHAFTGVQPKDAYVRAVNALSAKGDAKKAAKPDGRIIDGIRVIKVPAGIEPHDIYVYRGEEVKLVFPAQDFAYAVSMPGFGVNSSAELNKPLEVMFKAKKTGVFPIFCNGNCPAGDGAKHGNVIVVPYEAEKGAVFKHLSARESQAKIEADKPLVLDVRTPREFYSGHLDGAVLIPLQQLSSRLAEITAYKDKDILVYCRSGNRSIVAAQILIDAGFRRIYNMKSGIIEWQRDGLPVTK